MVKAKNQQYVERKEMGSVNLIKWKFLELKNPAHMEM